MTRRRLGHLKGEILAVDTTSFDALFGTTSTDLDAICPAIVILRRTATDAVMVDVFVDDDDLGWQRADVFANYLRTRARA